MAGGTSSKSWIILGAVTIVAVTCLAPLASGQNTTSTPSNTSTLDPVTSQSTQPPGQEATDKQKEVEAALLKNCSLVTNCTAENPITKAESDYKKVCKIMESFVQCVGTKCSSAANTTAFQQAKDKYKECSGCALQVSVVIMLLAVIGGRLI